MFGRMARLQRGPVVDRDDGALYAQVGQELAGELAGAPVAVVGHHQVVAGRQKGEQRQRDGCHAAGKEQRGRAAVQVGQFALGRRHGGVAVAAVLQPAVGPLLVGNQVGRVGKGKGAGLKDRRGERVVGLGARLAGVHRAG